MRRASLVALCPVMLSLAAIVPTARRAAAAPEEIQVYMDDMDAPGTFGLDLHNNYVISGSHMADYPGGQAPRHVYRLTPEFSYGLTKNVELGAYILSSLDSGGVYTVDGEKLRVKFIASRRPNQPSFWGANFEIGRVAHRFDVNPWNAELKGIYGYRARRWTFAVNPNLDWMVHGPAPPPASIELDSRVSFKACPAYEVGIESYNGIGPLRKPGRLKEEDETVYAVVDTEIHGWGLDFGVGRGVSRIADGWVLKAIVSVPFGK